MNEPQTASVRSRNYEKAGQQWREVLIPELGGACDFFTGGVTICAEHVHVGLDRGVDQYPCHLSTRIFLKAPFDLFFRFRSRGVNSHIFVVAAKKL